MITYVKAGAIGLAVLLLVGLGFYLGTLKGDASAATAKTAAEGLHTAQLQAVVTALDNNARQAAADHVAQQKVIDAYDAIKDIPDPASIGTAHRVFLLAASAGSCAVPEGASVAGGSPGATGSAREAPKAQQRLVVEADLNDYIAACGRDDKRLTLAQGLAPKL